MIGRYRLVLVALTAIILIMVLGRMLATGGPALFSPKPQSPIESFMRGEFSWTVGPPLVVPKGPDHAIKDPSIVRYKGRWHLFYTLRGPEVRIGYLAFDDWEDAATSRRHALPFGVRYAAAPQVFYYSPHWYLIYQIQDDTIAGQRPVYSRTTDIADPDSWSPPASLFPVRPENVEAWVDFWVIFDQARAHLFFTSLDGRMWRADTGIADFPHGWGRPSVVLQGDFYEASHTYRVKGLNKFLTIIEARAPARGRYHQAYIADRLEGEWKPLAVSQRRPFAGPSNVRHLSERWTDWVSHGELIRTGFDQTLEVDPANLRLVFQGVASGAARGRRYPDLPWQLGLLDFRLR